MSLKLSVFYIGVALLFGLWVWFERGPEAGILLQDPPPDKPQTLPNVLQQPTLTAAIPC